MGRQINFTAEEELIAKIDEIAEKITRSRSDTIEMLLKLAVATYGSGKMTEGIVPASSLLVFPSFKEAIAHADIEKRVLYASLTPEQKRQAEENYKRGIKERGGECEW